MASFPYMGWLISHSCFSLWCFPLGFSQQMVSESLVCGLGEYSLILVSKVFLTEVSGKRVSYKCVNGDTSEGSWVMYSGLRMLPLEGECINVKEGLSLEGEIVRYSSVSLSPRLGRNEKVEQYIRKKTHKPNVLRFWVEGGVIPLCGLTRFSFLWDLPGVFSSDSPNKWYQSQWFAAWSSTVWHYIKSFRDGDFRQVCPV